MSDKLIFKVGDEVFVPPRYSGEDGSIYIILKVGVKFAYAVSNKYINTEDEKECTHKIDLKTNTINLGHSREVYRNQAEYLDEIKSLKEHREKLEMAQKGLDKELTIDQINRILAIIQEPKN